MRIAFLTPEYARPGFPAGGLANYLKRLTGFLKAAGHEPVVFMTGNQDRSFEIDGVEVIEVAAYDGRPVWALWKFSIFLSYYRILKTSKRLTRAFLEVHQSEPFDLVQSASYLSPGLDLLKMNVLPVTVRVSSYTPMWRAPSGRRQHIGEHIADWAELRQMQFATRLFAPSRLLSRSLKRMEGLDADVIRTPFVMDQVEEDASVYHDALGGKQYLFFWGKMNMVKGADLLIRALPEVMDQYPELHVGFAGVDSLICDGRSCVELMEEVLAGTIDRVHYWPKLEKAQLYPMIRNAYGIVLPSRIDNYPNTCLEAQHFGKVVIGTQDSSLDEMIVDGVDGVLVENDSVESLREGILKLLSMSKDNLREMERQASETSLRRSPNEAVESLLGYYKRTIADFNKGGK